MKKINSLGIKLSLSFVDEFVWNLRDIFKHRVIQALCRSEKMRLHVFYSMTVHDTESELMDYRFKIRVMHEPAAVSNAFFISGHPDGEQRCGCY